MLVGHRSRKKLRQTEGRNVGGERRFPGRSGFEGVHSGRSRGICEGGFRGLASRTHNGLAPEGGQWEAATVWLIDLCAASREGDAGPATGETSVDNQPAFLLVLSLQVISASFLMSPVTSFANDIFGYA